MFGFLTSSSTTRLYRGRAPRQERLTILRAATHETELGDHDFCLSRSHYTDTDPTCRERAATAGIEPGTSSPGDSRAIPQSYRAPRGGGGVEAVAQSVERATPSEEVLGSITAVAARSLLVGSVYNVIG